jgi:cellulose synthase/poly-beta-1,6-N-acetylglucosamine synthase-like glycosyltransferase
MALVVYHHVGYPVILKYLAKRRQQPPVAYLQRGYRDCPATKTLPSITLIMPAFNEAGMIEEKIRNLAAIDYPAEKLEVVLVCDGCVDDTARIACEIHREPACTHLNLTIVEHRDNRGKLAIVNESVLSATADLVALSDVSALISVDAMLIAVGHFGDENVGVVSGTYRMLQAGSAGEESYWQYQTAIKTNESALGSTIGVHGAFYVFRRELFSPLPADTINDDFVLPMAIVARGYRAVYEKRINALELECADTVVDHKRRRRIAAGNVQQVLRLWRLLHPRRKGIAFNFASGKTMRVVMPCCLLAAFIGSAVLSVHSLFFLAMTAAQSIGYGVFLYRHFTLTSSAPKIIDTIHYMVSGHLAGLIGGSRYLLGLEQGRWRRVTTTKEIQS